MGISIHWRAFILKGSYYQGWAPLWRSRLPVLQPRISLNQKPLHIWTRVYYISHLSILNLSFIAPVLQPRISLNQKSLCIRTLVYYISPLSILNHSFIASNCFLFSSLFSFKILFDQRDFSPPFSPYRKKTDIS